MGLIGCMSETIDDEALNVNQDVEACNKIVNQIVWLWQQVRIIISKFICIF